MIRPLFWLLLALSPTVTLAETLAVKSGEHADFSRLVIQFPVLPTWEFGRTDDGYALRTDSKDSLDASRVFQRMPRTRIAAVRTPSAGRLEFQVTCDCAVDVFELSNGRIVVDVKNTRRDPNSRFEKPLPLPASAIAKPGLSDLPGAVRTIPAGGLNFGVPWPEDDFAAAQNEPVHDQRLPEFATPFPNMPAAPTNAPPVADIVEATEAETIDPPAAVEYRESVAKTSIPETEIPIAVPLRKGLALDPQTRAQAMRVTRELLLTQPPAPATPALPNANVSDLKFVGISEQSLLAELQRAAAQGLIEIAPPRLRDKPQVDADAARPSSGLTAKVPSETQNSPPPTLADHLAMQTAADQAAADLAPEHAFTLDGNTCLDENNFDIATWNEDPKESGTGTIVGEFDRPEHDFIMQTAHHLIYQGFGAEAKALLSAFDLKDDGIALLLELAAVMDEMPGNDLPLLKSQISCATSAAMWSVLAYDNVPPGAHPDVKSVLFTFSALPIHLREHLGPRLAQRFLDIKDIDTATGIRDQINRTAVSNPASLTLVNARINALGGQEETAIAEMKDVVAADISMSPQALVELIETQLAGEKPVSAADARLADALAVEHRGTPLGKQLTKTAIRALAVSGNVDITFERIALALSNGDLDEKEAEALSADAHLKNANVSDDEAFLKLATGYPLEPGYQSPAAQTARRAMASRLVDLGLADAVEELLRANQPTGQAEDRKLLARAALAADRPTEALVQLEGLNGAAVDRMRARANEMLDDFTNAMALLERAGEPEGLDSLAWRGGDWAFFASEDQSVHARAAALVQNSGGGALTSASDSGKTARDKEDVKQLATARAKVEESQAAREVFSALLQLP